MIDYHNFRHNEAQIIIKRIVKEIRLNTAGKKCDVFLHNGLKLLNFPLDKVVDGAQWMEILPLIDGDEFDFEGFSTKPRHIALEDAPEWVKEMEEHPISRCEKFAYNQLLTS